MYSGKIKTFQLVCLAMAFAVLASCTRQEGGSRPQPSSAPANTTRIISDRDIHVAKGQTIYVPVYSHIHVVDERRSANLAATLSIRNTDPSHPIIVTSVRYYDSAGKLVRHYVKDPLSLAPMASTGFVVAKDDTSGGVGANFVVQWVAEENVDEPVVEAVMIGSAGTLGISFVSPGRVYANPPQ